jgi:hypothetical protein
VANTALTYAENVLGVHECYNRAQEAHAELDEVVTALDKAQDKRRSLTDAIADREIDLLSEEWAKHPEMAASRMDQHVKIVKRKDTLLSGLRDQLSAVSGEINGLEYDADICKQRIKIESARMVELGGYFNYLSAIKQAETIAKQTNQESKE